MIHHENSPGAVSDVLIGDPLDMMSREDHCDPSLGAAKKSGLPQYFERQTVMGMISVVSEYPDL